MLDTANEAALSLIEEKGRKARASEVTIDTHKETARLKPATKTLMVETAPRWLPKLLRLAGLNPENAPEAMAGVGALLWGAGIYRACSALDKEAKALQASEAAQSAKPHDTQAA